jgi:hypothetical protein
MRKPMLTEEQLQIIARLSDYAVDYKGTFAPVVKKVLPGGFGTGPAAREFRKRDLEVFRQERGG